MSIRIKTMGSDSNCNNTYYNNVEQSSAPSSVPYYQTLTTHNSSSQSHNMTKNEWITSEQNSDAQGSSQNQDSESEGQRDQIMKINSEISNGRSHKGYSHQQHLQMSAPQWSFPVGNSYQRFYSDAHYGIVITPNTSQASSLTSTPSSSLHSLNDAQSQNLNHHHVHQLQSAHHLKKIYYQGSIITLSLLFRCTQGFNGRVEKSGNQFLR